MAARLNRTPTKEAIEVSKQIGCSYLMLGHGRFCLIDTSEQASLKDFLWYLGERGYVCTHPYVNGKQTTLYLHRVIMHASDTEEVDHRDRNKLDNRKVNLRLAQPFLNTANAPRRSHNRASKFKGVRRNHGTGNFAARIGMHRKGIHLGTFYTETAAAMAYNRAAKQLFGDFACLNPV